MPPKHAVLPPISTPPVLYHGTDAATAATLEANGTAPGQTLWATTSMDTAVSRRVDTVARVDTSSLPATVLVRHPGLGFGPHVRQVVPAAGAGIPAASFLPSISKPRAAVPSGTDAHVKRMQAARKK